MADAIDRATVYRGEALLLRWSESAKGRSVTVQLDEHVGAHHPFKSLKCGENGSRLMLVAVLIGDDEQPTPAGGAQRSAKEPVPIKTVKPFRELKRSAQAALKCQERDFYGWLSHQTVFNEVTRTLSGSMTDPEIADVVVKRICGIESKRELDIDVAKGKIWDGILTEYEVRNYRK